MLFIIIRYIIIERNTSVSIFFLLYISLKQVSMLLLTSFSIMFLKAGGMAGLPNILKNNQVWRNERLIKIKNLLLLFKMFSKIIKFFKKEVWTCTWSYRKLDYALVTIFPEKLLTTEENNRMMNKKFWNFGFGALEVTLFLAHGNKMNALSQPQTLSQYERFYNVRTPRQVLKSR